MLIFLVVPVLGPGKSSPDAALTRFTRPVRFSSWPSSPVSISWSCGGGASSKRASSQFVGVTVLCGREVAGLGLGCGAVRAFGLWLGVATAVGGGGFVLVEAGGRGSSSVLVSVGGSN